MKTLIKFLIYLPLILFAIWAYTRGISAISIVLCAIGIEVIVQLLVWATPYTDRLFRWLEQK